MIDRTELDLRFDAHARMARALGGHGREEVVVFPLPRLCVALAAALVRLSARLAPAPRPTLPADRGEWARPTVG